MAEKTEQPTPKKLREARKKGNVAFSRDANGVATYIAGVAVLFLIAPGVARLFTSLYTEMIHMMVTAPLSSDSWNGLMKHGLSGGLQIILPFVFSLAVVGLVLGLAQTGMNVSAENMKPKLNKLNPMNRLKQWFSPSGLFEFVKTLLKLFIVFFIGYLVIKSEIFNIIRLVFVQSLEIGPYFQKLSKSLLFRVAMVFAVIGAVDFFFQRKQWKKKLMMTKDEVKREFKESEGDPLIKGQRKQLHMQMISQSVPRAVARADAVTVNPNHLAVVIEYDRETMVAPKVTAKGQEHLARKIIELAKKYNVPIIRDVTLTRALFEVEVDEYIPEELFEAVAEVLLFAWKMREEAERNIHDRNLA